jgi:exoribonuclease R
MKRKINMARPTKEQAPLDKVLPPIRVTAEQAQILKDKAEKAGLNLSDFLRVELLNAKPRQRKKPAPPIEKAIESLGQLGSIRADLNQILKDRFVHTFIKPERAEKAFKAIEDLSNHLHSVIEKYGH